MVVRLKQERLGLGELALAGEGFAEVAHGVGDEPVSGRQGFAPKLEALAKDRLSLDELVMAVQGDAQVDQRAGQTAMVARRVLTEPVYAVVPDLLGGVRFPLFLEEPHQPIL